MAATTNRNETDRQEQILRDKIQKQVDSDRRAFHLVEQLLESPISKEFLVSACQLITPSHYADVVEERAIVYKCGYPICDNPLGKIPAKKYYISTRQNRVFDITERKNFCSDHCLEASRYLAAQIPDSPLWAEDRQQPLSIQLLARNKARGEPGLEVIGYGTTYHLSDYWAKERHEKRHMAKEVLLSSSDKEILEKSSTCSATLPPKLNPSPGQTPLAKQGGTVSDHAIIEELQQLKLTDVSIGLLASREPGSLEFSGWTGSSHCVDEEVPDGTSHPGSQQTGLPFLEEASNLGKEAAEFRHVSQLLAQDPDSGQADSSTEPAISALCQDDFVGTVRHPYHVLVSSDPSLHHQQSVVPSSLSQHCYRDVSVPQHPDGGSGSTVAGQEASEVDKVDRLKSLLDKKKNLLSRMADIQDLPPLAETGQPRFGGPGEDTERRPALAVDRKSPDFPVITHGSQSMVQLVQEGTHPLWVLVQRLCEWITMDTKAYLCRVELAGGSAVDGDLERRYENLATAFAARERQLEALELESGDSTVSVQPLPSYQKLAEETRSFSVKVHQFLQGCLVGEQADIDRDSEESPVFLPTVDSHDQMVVRHRIVLDHLDRAMLGLLPSLSLTIQDVASPLRKLVHTFRLSSDNITYRPSQWMFIGLLLLKLLAQREVTIQTALSQPAAVKFLTIFLRGVNTPLADLDILATNLLEPSGRGLFSFKVSTCV